MKKSNLIKNVTLLVLVSGMIVSCKKEAGSGGNSSIKGNVKAMFIGGGNASTPEAEITSVTFTQGAIVDDNDYWLINAASGNKYYVWYDNSNWVGGDPALAGRIGIKVDYDFGVPNNTMASLTKAAMEAVSGGDFIYTLSGDILTVTDANTGVVVDADNMNSPFSIDVLNQGKSSNIAIGIDVEGPVIDERVYLIYGDEDFYSESVRTDNDGNYQFKGLNKGNYRIYAFSKDTLNPNFDVKVEVSAEITKHKTVVDAGEIYLIK